MTPVHDEAAGPGLEAVALSSVAHDLDNLLGAMALRADLIERQLSKGDERAARASVDVMRRAVEESRRLTMGLRSIVRRAVPTTRAVDLVWLLDQLAPLLDAMAGDSIVVERHLDDVPEVQTSQLGLRRSLLNLVVNSKEALAGSEGTVVITATESERDGKVGVDLSVADDGPGMAPELLANATEPNVSSKSGSSGLGLATVADLVRASQGHLAIESAPGEGCTVTIWLPAAPPSDEAEASELHLARG